MIIDYGFVFRCLRMNLNVNFFVGISKIIIVEFCDVILNVVRRVKEVFFGMEKYFFIRKEMIKCFLKFW